MPQWVDDDTLDRVGFVLKCSFLVWITWLVIDYLDLEDTNFVGLMLVPIAYFFENFRRFVLNLEYETFNINSIISKLN